MNGKGHAQAGGTGGAAAAPPGSPNSGPTLRAPDVTIPLRFLVTGILCLVGTVVLLVVHPEMLTAYHYHQHTVAITHLLVLGFGMSIVMGATYQLVPVALETTLHSERVARWHFPIHAISVAGMVYTFWIWNLKEVGHFGSGLALGAGLFVWNMVKTLRRVRGWTVVSFGIASTLFWLTAVIGVGLAIAAAKCTYELVDRPNVFPLLAWTLAGLKAIATFLAKFDALPAMHAHAHLGVLGVFIVLIVGVGYQLVPMFVIGSLQNRRRAWASLWLLNAGLAASFVAIAIQSRLKPLAAALVIAGLLLYGIELAAVFRARRRRVLDWGLHTFLASQILLVPLAGIGLWLSQPGLALDETTGRIENAYGYLALLGVVALAILGMLQKILPFLVWFAAYSREVGRARTPALHEMYSTRLQSWALWLWLGGIAAGVTGILAGSNPIALTGSLLLASSLAVFAINATLVLRHLVRPRLVPLSIPLRPTPATP